MTTPLSILGANLISLAATVFTVGGSVDGIKNLQTINNKQTIVRIESDLRTRTQIKVAQEKAVAQSPSLYKEETIAQSSPSDESAASSTSKAPALVQSPIKTPEEKVAPIKQQVKKNNRNNKKVVKRDVQPEVAEKRVSPNASFSAPINEPVASKSSVQAPMKDKEIKAPKKEVLAKPEVQATPVKKEIAKSAPTVKAQKIKKTQAPLAKKTYRRPAQKLKKYKTTPAEKKNDPAPIKAVAKNTPNVRKREISKPKKSSRKNPNKSFITTATETVAQPTTRAQVSEAPAQESSQVNLAQVGSALASSALASSASGIALGADVAFAAAQKEEVGVSESIIESVEIPSAINLGVFGKVALNNVNPALQEVLGDNEQDLGTGDGDNEVFAKQAPGSGLKVFGPQLPVGKEERYSIPADQTTAEVVAKANIKLQGNDGEAIGTEDEETHKVENKEENGNPIFNIQEATLASQTSRTSNGIQKEEIQNYFDIQFTEDEIAQIIAEAEPSSENQELIAELQENHALAKLLKNAKQGQVSYTTPKLKQACGFEIDGPDALVSALRSVVDEYNWMIHGKLMVTQLGKEGGTTETNLDFIKGPAGIFIGGDFYEVGEPTATPNGYTFNLTNKETNENFSCTAVDPKTICQGKSSYLYMNGSEGKPFFAKIEIPQTESQTKEGGL